eukprot:evm.model.scf_98.11 EVM.evm.TU.scf_98.11   scf_98:86739-94967(-)
MARSSDSGYDPFDDDDCCSSAPPSTMGYSTGYTTCGTDEEMELFDDEDEPVKLLQGMMKQHDQTTEAAVQQFEILRMKKREKELAEESESVNDGDEDDRERACHLEQIRAIDEFDKTFGRLDKRTRKGRRRRKRTERSGKMADARKMMAEATLLFARSELEEASRLCMDVIRLAPNTADAFHTMGMIMEAKGNPRRALDYFMIAVHMTPGDLSLWKRLALVSTEVGFLRQAIYCLTRVIKRDSDDLDAQWDRALLYAEVKELGRATEAFEHVAQMRPGDAEVPKMLAKLYHRMGRSQAAVEVLEKFLLEYQAQTDLTHINILAELYLLQGRYSETSALIERTERVLCHGQLLPIDLRVKAGVCVAHTGNLPDAEKHLQQLLLEPVNDYPDLYMEAGDALLRLGHLHKANEFLEQLLRCPESNNRGLWTKLIKCARPGAGVLGAVAVYNRVLQSIDVSHPGYIEATLLCVEALIEAEDFNEADKIMTNLHNLMNDNKVHVPEDRDARASLLLWKERLRLAIGRDYSFLDHMVPVIANTVKLLRSQADNPRNVQLPHEFLRLLGKQAEAQVSTVSGAASEATSAVTGGSDVDTGMESEAVFKGHRHHRREKYYRRRMEACTGGIDGETDVEGGEQPATLTLDGMLRNDDQFDMLLQVIEALETTNRVGEARSLAECMLQIILSSRGKHYKKELRDVLRLRLAELQCKDGNLKEALIHQKHVCMRWPNSVNAWNQFSKIVCQLGGAQWIGKFLTASRQKCPTSVPGILMMGHILSVAGQHGGALGEYFQAYRLLPQHPLIILCLGVAFVNHSMTRHVGDRHRAILKAFAFLEAYERARGNGQESAYNAARAAHQLGLAHVAVPLYERALQTEPPSAGEGWEGFNPHDLRRDAAHNLVQILKESGAVGLAREVMQKYLTI